MQAVCGRADAFFLHCIMYDQQHCDNILFGTSMHIACTFTGHFQTASLRKYFCASSVFYLHTVNRPWLVKVASLGHIMNSLVG